MGRKRQCNLTGEPRKRELNPGTQSSRPCWSICCRQPRTSAISPQRCPCPCPWGPRTPSTTCCRRCGIACAWRRSQSGHRRKRARARANCQAPTTESLVQDRALGGEDHVTFAQLLLHLADQTALHFLHALPRTVRNEDHGCLATLLHIHFLHRGDLDVAHVVLELRRAACLEVEQGLRNLLLQLVRGRALLLDDLLAGVEHRASFL